MLLTEFISCLHDGARFVYQELIDVGDKNGQDRQQYLKLVNSKFRLPHFLPTSIEPADLKNKKNLYQLI